MTVAIDTLLSPVVLFFLLGLGAALGRSQMSVPEAFAKGIAIYLMMAIGMKGGVEMSKSLLSSEVVWTMTAALVLSFLIPFVAYGALRISTGLERVDAAATAAHYGSISIVTFVAASEAIQSAGFATSGHFVAAAALMETPAIVSALLIWGWGNKKGEASRPVAGAEPGELFREVALNASVVVLIGALVIGWIAGEEGFEPLKPFFVTPFQGVLCLFLLDMGLAAGRGLRQGWRKLGFNLIAFGIYMPLISAAFALAAARAIGLDVGNTAIFMTLSASASYIAVPAAMRLALPQAQPSIYLTLSLGITFPFNIAAGIPLYLAIAQMTAS